MEDEKKHGATGGVVSTSHQRLAAETTYQHKAEQLLADENCFKIVIVSCGYCEFPKSLCLFVYCVCRSSFWLFSLWSSQSNFIEKSVKLICSTEEVHLHVNTWMTDLTVRNAHLCRYGEHSTSLPHTSGTVCLATSESVTVYSFKRFIMKTHLFQ